MKNFANFTEKHLCWSLLLLELHASCLQLYWKEIPTQVLSCQICEIFKNTYFVEHLRTAASDGSESDGSESDDDSYNEGIQAVVCRCSSK